MEHMDYRRSIVQQKLSLLNIIKMLISCPFQVLSYVKNKENGILLAKINYKNIRVSISLIQVFLTSFMFITLDYRITSF